MRIIGIDPGYDRVGWAVGEEKAGQLTLVAFGCIQTKPSDRLSERYAQIDQELTALVKQYQPKEAAIESLFFARNTTTALHVSEARGVTLSVFFRFEILPFEYTPLQVKQAVTGYGRAEKSAVERMVRLQLKPELLKGSGEKIIDDTLDAMAVAMTHAASRQLAQPI